MPAEFVITGFGAVGPFGGSCDALHAALQAQVPLTWPSRRLSAGCQSAEILEFNLADFRRTARGHRAPRISQYALAAAAQAVAQARLEERECNRDEVAIVYGTGNGPGEVVTRNLKAITNDGLGAVEPLSFQESVFNAPASLVGIEYGFRGPLLALPMGWAAGAYAVAAAAELIVSGHAQVALVVASDEVTELTHDAMCALGLARGADSSDPWRRMRGHKHRHPIPVVPAEGGAALVLETRASAEARRVPALLELAGWGVNSDAFGVGAKGAGRDALRLAMRAAIARAGNDKPSLLFAGSYCSDDADHAEREAIASVYGPDETPQQVNLRQVVGEAKAPTALYSLMAADAAFRASGSAHGSALCNAFWVNGTNASLLVRRAR